MKMPKSNFQRYKQYYEDGLWNAEMLANAVAKGKITTQDYAEIVGYDTDSAEYL